MRTEPKILLVGILAATQAFLPCSAQNPPTASPASAAQTAAANTTPPDDNARKAKALLDQMIQALGGEAYLGLQDLKQEGRTYSFFHGQPTGAGAPFWRFWKWPDKERLELTKQRDWVIIHNGDQGYEVTFRGVGPEDPKTFADYQRRRKFALEWVLRGWLRQPGIALFYEGPAIAAQKQAEQVTILNAKNEGVTIDIDGVTHLPIKKTFSWRDPADGQRNEESEIYENFKTVQGISTPLSITRMMNGDISNQRFISSMSYNQSLPDSMFQPSSGEKAKKK